MVASGANGGSLAAQEVLGLLDEDVAAHVGDGFSERQLLGAGFNAVLRKAALLNAAVAGQSTQTVFLEDLAGGMVVEQLDLRDGGRAYKICVFIELRANLHAAAAGDAVRQRVVSFLLLREDARSGAEIVRSIDGNPGFDGHQVVKEDRAIDLEIADQRELREGLNLDGLFEVVNERRAGHARFAVDKHGAGTADFLKAI